MPEGRLARTRAAYHPSPQSSVDYQAGPALYVPCPNHCGRLVAERVRDRPCTRCQKIADDRQRAWAGVAWHPAATQKALDSVK